MSTPALKPLPSARRITTLVSRSARRLVEGGGDVEPALHGQRVDRGSVHRDDADAVGAQLAGDGHDALLCRPTKHLLGRVAAWRSPSTCPAGSCWSPAAPAGSASASPRRSAPPAPRWCTCSRSEVDGATDHHVCDVRDPEAVAAHGRARSSRAHGPARRAGQQRRRGARRARRDRLAAVPRQDRRPQPAQPAARRAGRQRGDAAAGRAVASIVNISSIGANRPAPTHRGVRRGQGRPRLADHVAGDGVGPEGAGQRHRRRPVPHRADRRPLRRRRPGRRHRADHPARPDGPARGGRQRRGVPGQRPRVVRLRRPRRLRRRRRAPRLPAHPEKEAHDGLLEGRVAIVTGAGRGIGRAHALELASHGAAVVVNDYGVSLGRRGHGGVARRARSSPRSRRPAAGRSPTAPTSPTSRRPRRWSGRRSTTFGGLDILVNNAGFVRDRMLVNTSEEEWDAVIRVHLKGHFAPLRHAGAYWRAESKEGRQRAARVINTSSGAGLQGSVGQATYSAAKAGIAGLTLVAAQEMGRYGVTVNAIAPVARTRMTEGAFDTSAMAAARGQLAARRLARLGGGRRRHRPGHRDRRRRRSPSRTAGRTAPRATRAAAGSPPRSAPRCASCSPRRRPRSPCTAPRLAAVRRAIATAGCAILLLAGCSRRRVRAGGAADSRDHGIRDVADREPVDLAEHAADSPPTASPRSSASTPTVLDRLAAGGQGGGLDVLPGRPRRRGGGGVVLERRRRRTSRRRSSRSPSRSPAPWSAWPRRTVTWRSSDKAADVHPGVAGHRSRTVTVRNLLSNDSGRFWSPESDYRRAPAGAGPDVVRRGPRAERPARHGLGLQQRRDPDARPGDPHRHRRPRPTTYAQERLFGPLGMDEHPDDAGRERQVDAGRSSACSRPAPTWRGSGSCSPSRASGTASSCSPRPG